MRILLISESFIVREAVGALFTKNLKVTSIGIISDLYSMKKEDLEEINFIFLDMKENLPQKIMFLNTVKGKYGNIKVITLDLNKDIKIFKRVVDMGIEGYIVDIDDKEEFIYTMSRVFKGKKVYEADALQAVVQRDKSNDLSVLTPRERDVLYNISKGYNNKEIAKILYISDYTVKKHVSSILSKLNLKNRQEAIIYVNENKFEIIS
ncbi:LuxR C-terminal-related transcriptional regulator [Faecalimicrobium sp. JNUCC 81]